MRTYMLFMASVNAMGVLLLYGAMSESFADKLLRTWTGIIPKDKPYKHSEYSRLWLWWAAIGTAFFVILNFVGRSWPVEYARWIVIGNCVTYLSFEVAAILGTIFARHRYGPGLYITHFLWLGQGGWGVYIAATM